MTAAWSWQRVRAVVQVELRSLARQKTPFVLRTVYAVLVLMGVMAAGSSMLRLFTNQGWSGESMALLGAKVFASVVVIQSVLATVLGILLGVASMYSERNNKTLGLLVLSQLRSGEILFGKFLAILGLVVTVQLAGLPVFALLGWAGGVDYGWLGWLAAYTVVLAGLGTAAGLAGGLKWQSPAGAAAASLALLIVPVAISLPFLGSGVSSCLVGPLLFPATIPLGVAVIAMQEIGAIASGTVALGMIVSGFAIWLLLSQASKILAEVVAKGPGRGLRGVFEELDDFFEAINVGGIRFDLGHGGRPRGNPVTWLTRTASGFGLPHYSFRLIAAAVFFFLIALALATVASIWGQIIVGAGALTAVAIPLTAGANAFGDEKVRKTFAVLLATPLTAPQILRGKLWVFLRLLVIVTVPAACLVVLMVRVDAFGADQLIELSGLFVAEAFLAYFLSLFFSLVADTPLRAGVGAAAFLVVLHGLYALGFLSAVMPAPAWVVVRGVLVAWILLAAAAGVLVCRRRRPALGLAMLLVALAPALGMVPAHPFQPEAEVITAALFLFVYTMFTFDRAVGRTP